MEVTLDPTVDIVFRYFPQLTDTQREQFRLLGTLYPHWNAQINVISRKDIGSLYLHHVLHSLGIAKFVQFRPGTRLLDVGTGGGFPGIPLAILFPEVRFDLVDSIGKKIKVVNAIVEATGLQNVNAYHKRAEELTGQYDFVVSRAVTQLAEFHRWVAGKIAKQDKNAIANGILYLKGGDLTAEINASRRYAEVHPLSDYFQENFFETKHIVYVPA